MTGGGCRATSAATRSLRWLRRPLLPRGSGQFERQADAVERVGAGAGAFGRKAFDDLEEQVAQAVQVRRECREHLLLRDALPLFYPGVKVGDERERRVAEREFAGEHGLRVAGHADEGPPLAGVPLRLGAGGG